MTTRLSPGILIEAASIALDHAPLPPEQVVAGTPTTGTLTLDESDGDDGDGREIGVWEMTPGTATDTEIDEVFIVLTGRATVTFDSVPSEQGPDATPTPAIELTPGAVVRLTAGMRTTWTVHETLRKIYVA